MKAMHGPIIHPAHEGHNCLVGSPNQQAQRCKRCINILDVYGRTAVWQFRGRLEPGRSRLRMLKGGKAWQYQALSVGCLFFGVTNKTWIRSKPRMRKTMTIPTLTHHIEARSSWDWRSRRKNSFSALPVFAFSISSLDISLMG